MAYSQDLRERVTAAGKAGEQLSCQIALTFRVSKSTVDKWSRRWRETDQVAAKPWVGGPKRAVRECAVTIRAGVRKRPDLTVVELCERVEATKGVKAKQSMMSRELARLKLPRIKRALTKISGTRRG